MHSGLADFIELESGTIIEHAITFARTVDVGAPLDESELDTINELYEKVKPYLSPDAVKEIERRVERDKLRKR